MANAEAGMTVAEQKRAERAAQAALWNLSKHPVAVLVIAGLAGALSWLALGVSELKTGQAVQAEQLVRIESGINERLLELLVVLAAAQGVRVPRTGESP